MMSRRRPLAALSLTAVGVGLLIITLTSGWWALHTDWNPWTIAGHEYHFEGTSTYLPGPDYAFRCSVNNTSMPGWGQICPGTGPNGILNPYAEVFIPRAATVAVYADLELAIWATIAVALLGAGLLAVRTLYRDRGPKRAARRGWIVILAAGVLALAIPMGLAFAQPSAFSHDNPDSSTAVDSFWGSCHSTSDPSVCGVNTTQSWGPATGWYLSVAAGGAFLVSGILARDPAVLREAHPP